MKAELLPQLANLGKYKIFSEDQGINKSQGIQAPKKTKLPRGADAETRARAVAGSVADAETVRSEAANDDEEAVGRLNAGPIPLVF